MKKMILTLLLVSTAAATYSQRTDTPRVKETGFRDFFDGVYDNYGNKYKFSEIEVRTPKGAGREALDINASTLMCNPGIFDVYFETGSGMSSTTDPVQIARRNVVCTALQDISNFIVLPTLQSGSNARVRIWVRNIASIPGVPAGVLGLVTPFFTYPSIYPNPNPVGGIADNEIWKTLHTGKDSYTSILGINTATTGGTYAGDGIFFHGMMAFNFSGSTVWNTDLSVPAAVGQQDLYTVILHEMTHTLGFATRIGVDGVPNSGSSYYYYSRYDQFLNYAGSSPIPLISNTNASSSMYNYRFNTSGGVPVSSLYPGCTAPSHTNTAYPSIIRFAIRLSGILAVPE
ncbi:hypothetical protein [Flavobacterium sp. 3HN19-14]|uniref:hypothetical protein n=1 Tax=Flavobacterium sp. 3HN19-14 TaxID=3448133 RepID=UPI003EE23C53